MKSNELYFPLVIVLGLCGSTCVHRESCCNRVDPVQSIEHLIARARDRQRAEWFPSAKKLGTIADSDDGSRERIWSEAKVNSLGMKFSLIAPGSFTMGPDISRFFSLQPGHLVEITQPFFISVTEVTNFQFSQVFPEYIADAEYSPDPDGPAVNVTWENAVKFCEILSKKEDAVYSLPTEAQWEYACRAGSKSAYCFGWNADRLSEFAWWNYVNGRASPVGTLQPNAWWLYDMHGNAFEWVSDRYSDSYYSECAAVGQVTDPMGPSDGQVHVLRSGGWQVRNPDALTCTFRMPLPLFDRRLLDPDPVGLRRTIGFRIVRFP